jgi:LPXTG-motif cell wall-anchored protein
MKKALAIIVTVAMLVSLFAIASHANNAICFDGAFFTNRTEGLTHVPAEGEKDVKGEAAGNGDLGSVYGLGFSYFHLQGWIADDDDFEDIGYSINGGEIIWGAGIYDANLWDEAGNSRTGIAHNLRYNLTLDVLEGDYTLKLVKKMVGGEEREVKTLKYSNKAPDPNVKTYSNKVVGGGDNNIGVWLQGANTVATIKFTAAGTFNGFGLPIYWASNEGAGNGAFAKITVELFKFANNTENTLAQSPVKAYNLDGKGDNNPAIAFTFDDALEAGTYICRISLANPEDTIEVDGKEKASYLVLPKMNAGNPDEAKFEYNVDPFNVYVTGEDGIADFYAANPEETATPAGIINDNDYEVSYTIDKTNATSWANGQIGDISVTYFFNFEEDGLSVAVRALGIKDGEMVQLNFNPGNKLWEVPGQFISFKLGDALTVLQHNHKNGLLDNDSAGGADITDKVANQIVKIDNGYEFKAKLPKALFTITDVEGASDFVYGQDDLYFGMFLVAGGGGLSNQQNTDYTDWTCKGLALNQYKFAGTPAPVTEPETQPQTGDATVVMFAVIAVLAMGAAVVFMKKKAF